MKEKSNIQIISELAASQHGMFTTAQAASFGVARDALAYLAKSGRLDRVAHGVYRLCGTPRDGCEDIRAAWLSADPKRLAFDRLRTPEDVVIGGRSAAAMHGLGDFFLAPFRFYAKHRINSRNQGVSFARRSIAPHDVTVIDGLPVTSKERTLLDLYKDNEDPSLLADALRAAFTEGKGFDYFRMRDLFEEDSRDPRGVGEDAFADLLNESGITVVLMENDARPGDDARSSNQPEVMLVGPKGDLIPFGAIASRIKGIGD